jgi:hypothetical protein
MIVGSGAYYSGSVAHYRGDTQRQHSVWDTIQHWVPSVIDTAHVELESGRVEDPGARLKPVMVAQPIISEPCTLSAAVGSFLE